MALTIPKPPARVPRVSQRSVATLHGLASSSDPKKALASLRAFDTTNASKEALAYRAQLLIALQQQGYF